MGANDGAGDSGMGELMVALCRLGGRSNARRTQAGKTESTTVLLSMLGSGRGAATVGWSLDGPCNTAKTRLAAGGTVRHAVEAPGGKMASAGLLTDVLQCANASGVRPGRAGSTGAEAEQEGENGAGRNVRFPGDCSDVYAWRLCVVCDNVYMRGAGTCHVSCHFLQVGGSG